MAEPDRLFADALRLELKRAISASWKSRNTLFGGPYDPLSCYPDAPLNEDGGRIDISPNDCPRGPECCLKGRLVSRHDDLAAIRVALRGSADRQEIVRRARVVRQIEKHPTSIMDRDDCRSFGDAYFVLFCPNDAVIITTNMRDIEPMADALGLTAERP
jgi:hypothetical protein